MNEPEKAKIRKTDFLTPRERERERERERVIGFQHTVNRTGSSQDNERERERFFPAVRYTYFSRLSFLTHMSTGNTFSEQFPVAEQM